jgi:hypothetical protein
LEGKSWPVGVAGRVLGGWWPVVVAGQGAVMVDFEINVKIVNVKMEMLKWRMLKWMLK